MVSHRGSPLRPLVQQTQRMVTLADLVQRVLPLMAVRAHCHLPFEALTVSVAREEAERVEKLRTNVLFVQTAW